MIVAQWDDMLRLTGSFKFGHATASLLVGKLSDGTTITTGAVVSAEAVQAVADNLHDARTGRRSRRRQPLSAAPTRSAE